MKSGHNCKIHSTAIIDKNVDIKDGVTVGPFCYVGYSFYNQRNKYYGKKYKQGFLSNKNKKTTIGRNTYVGPYTIIGKGTKIGNDCLIEHNCYIGENSKLGNKVFLRYGCKIYNNVRIGNDCILSGFVCNNTRFGNNVEFFGNTIHRYISRKVGQPEPSPSIAQGVFVGFNAMIIGGITIGKNTRIGAGAIVTEDIKDNEVIGPSRRVVLK